MASDYYFTKDGKQYGPVSALQLRRLADTGRLQPTDRVREDGTDGWVAAAIVKGLFPTAPPGSNAASVIPVLNEPTTAGRAEAVVQAVPVEEVVEAQLVMEAGPVEERRPKPRGQVSSDFAEALKALALNPVGGLPEAYARLGKTGALVMGLACSVVFVLCLVLFVYVAPSLLAGSMGVGADSRNMPSTRLPGSSSSSSTASEEAKALFKVAALGAVFPLGLFLGSLGFRKLFQAWGELEADVFLAGVTLAPVALFLLIACLGIRVAEVNLAFFLFTSCLSTLIPYGGFTRLHGLSGGAGVLAVSGTMFLICLILDVLMRWVLF
jgi:GYF domain 2